jgi:hypothetical protein
VDERDRHQEIRDMADMDSGTLYQHLKVVVRPAASLADAEGSYGTGWIDWGGGSSSDQVVGMLAKRVRVISSLGTLDGVSSTSVVAEGLSCLTGTRRRERYCVLQLQC